MSSWCQSFRLEDGAADEFGDLRDDGVSEGAHSVHPMLHAGRDARDRGLLEPDGPHRFSALMRPISDRHFALHRLCFLLCVGMNAAPHRVQAFAWRIFRVPSRWSAFTWHGGQSTSNLSGSL